MDRADHILAINLANTELREAYNSGDIERVLAVFAAGFTDFSAGQPSFYSHEARAVLKQRLTQLFRTYDARLAITVINYLVRGDTAIDYGWRELALMPKAGGETVITRTRYVSVWQRSAQGKWQIKIFIDNADLPPQLPEEEDPDLTSTAIMS